jgi:hypothetical protein
MTRRALASEILVVRSRGPNDVDWIIDLAVPGLIARVVPAAGGSRSPPG